MTGAAIVDGTLVHELGDGLLRVRVDWPGVSELAAGDPVALRLADDPDRYLGVVLAVLEDYHITVLLDRVAMTEQVMIGDESDRVPDVIETLGLDPRYG